MEIEDKLLELGFDDLGPTLVKFELPNDKTMTYYKSIGEFVIYNIDGTQHGDFETTDEDTMLGWIKLFSPQQISLKGKVQTNDYGTNVIVETEISNNTHHSHLNKSVIITQILTDEEIIKEGQKAMSELDPAELIKIYKGLLKVKDGFGVSNCSTPNGSTGVTHEYNDIMKYKLE